MKHERSLGHQSIRVRSSQEQSSQEQSGCGNNEGEEKKQLMFNVLEAELKNEHAQKSAKDTYLTENR
jgi:hypothetical protein